jgi:hypothetical protein
LELFRDPVAHDAHLGLGEPAAAHRDADAAPGVGDVVEPVGVEEE